jgi:hypothetical protein
MKCYGFVLDYYNSYQRYSYFVSHKSYGKRDGEWIELEGVREDIGENTILFFEKLFSKYLKTAYVDILNADKAELDVYRYEYDGPIVVIHKVIWRHVSNRISYLVYIVDEKGEKVRHLESSGDIKIFFSNLGLPIF